MQCFVYASARRVETYLWSQHAVSALPLPAELTSLLGDLRLVLELDLQPQRQLPREDASRILAHLHSQGWYLQLPPSSHTPTLSPA